MASSSNVADIPADLPFLHHWRRVHLLLSLGPDEITADVASEQEFLSLLGEADLEAIQGSNFINMFKVFVDDAPEFLQTFKHNKSKMLEAETVHNSCRQNTQWLEAVLTLIKGKQQMSEVVGKQHIFLDRQNTELRTQMVKLDALLDREVPSSDRVTHLRMQRQAILDKQDFLFEEFRSTSLLLDGISKDIDRLVLRFHEFDTELLRLLEIGNLLTNDAISCRLKNNEIRSSFAYFTECIGQYFHF